MRYIIGMCTTITACEARQRRLIGSGLGIATDVALHLIHY